MNLYCRRLSWSSTPGPLGSLLHRCSILLCGISFCFVVSYLNKEQFSCVFPRRPCLLLFFCVTAAGDPAGCSLQAVPAVPQPRRRWVLLRRDSVPLLAHSPWGEVWRHGSSGLFVYSRFPNFKNFKVRCGTAGTLPLGKRGGARAVRVWVTCSGWSARGVSVEGVGRWPGQLSLGHTPPSPN